MIRKKSDHIKTIVEELHRRLDVHAYERMSERENLVKHGLIENRDLKMKWVRRDVLHSLQCISDNIFRVHLGPDIMILVLGWRRRHHLLARTDFLS
jgi:hypothetical protein